MLRSLIDRIEPVPNGAELAIVRRGDLATILKFASEKRERRSLPRRTCLKGCSVVPRMTACRNVKTPPEGRGHRRYRWLRGQELDTFL